MNAVPSNRMFISDLVIKPVQGEKWELVQSLHFILDSDTIIDVPKGFVTDLASIPRIFTPLFPVHGLQTRAAVVHDYLYAERGEVDDGPFTRKQCDEIFLLGMEALGVGYLKRMAMYWAVRAGGYFAW